MNENPLIDYERLALIAEVYKTAFEARPTFSGPFGMQLSYLLGAIATDTTVCYTKGSTISGVMRGAFEEDHPVFRFLTHPGQERK